MGPAQVAKVVAMECALVFPTVLEELVVMMVVVTNHVDSARALKLVQVEFVSGQSGFLNAMEDSAGLTEMEAFVEPALLVNVAVLEFVNVTTTVMIETVEQLYSLLELTQGFAHNELAEIAHQVSCAAPMEDASKSLLVTF